MRTKIRTVHRQVNVFNVASRSILIEFAEVFSALKNIEFPHIYPDPESRKLRGLLVKCLRAILEPKDVLINTPPTFGMYEFDCSINSMF